MVLVTQLVMYRLISLFFFFFKQKTAYEMRISDWSSDVCSSDLVISLVLQVDELLVFGLRRTIARQLGGRFVCAPVHPLGENTTLKRHDVGQSRPLARTHPLLKLDQIVLLRSRFGRTAQNARNEIVRSEEHTSELQSLMRI